MNPTTLQDFQDRIAFLEYEIAKTERLAQESACRQTQRAAQEIQDSMNAYRRHFVLFLASLPEPKSEISFGLICKVPIPSQPGTFLEIRKSR